MHTPLEYTIKYKPTLSIRAAPRKIAHGRILRDLGGEETDGVGAWKAISLTWLCHSVLVELDLRMDLVEA